MKDLKVFSKTKFRRQLLYDAWSCASVKRVMLCTRRHPVYWDIWDDNNANRTKPLTYRQPEKSTCDFQVVGIYASCAFYILRDISHITLKVHISNTHKITFNAIAIVERRVYVAHAKKTES